MRKSCVSENEDMTSSCTLLITKISKLLFSLEFVRDLAFCIDKGRVSKTVELLNKGDSR